MYKKYVNLLLCCLWGFICTAYGQAGDRGEPTRIVSLGVCTDQLLLILAQRHRIASVTFLAGNPKISMMADKIGDIPLNYGQAEEVISFKPDLILAGVHGARDTVNLLRRLGYKVLQVENAQDFKDIRENLRLVGKAIHRSARAEAEIAAMDSKLQVTAGMVVPIEARKTFTNYDVNGYVAGKSTLFSAVAHASGYQTLGDRLNFSGYRQVHLEYLLMTTPDLVDLGYKWQDPPALATASLGHPALIKLVSKIDLVDYPGAVWTCGLPLLADMVTELRQRRLTRPEPG